MDDAQALEFAKQAIDEEKNVNADLAYLPDYEGKLLRSKDGDTIDVVKDGLRIPIRFAGIDSPEMSQKSGADALEFLNSIIGDNKVSVRGQTYDKYGRSVAVLYAGDKNLNVEMVKHGHAKVFSSFINDVYKKDRESLIEAEKFAKEHRLGIWSSDTDDTDFVAHRAKMKAEYGDRAGMIGHDTSFDPNMPKDGLYFARQAINEGKAAAVQRIEGNKKAGKSLIPKDKQYQVEDGFLDEAIGIIDYADNISRSFISGLGSGNALEYAGQAALKERYTSAESLKDQATRAMGLGKLRAGADDKSFQWGDLLDFGIDMGIDVFTSPLTYLTMGLSNLAKGAKLGKAAYKLGSVGRLVNKPDVKALKAFSKADDIKFLASNPASTTIMAKLAPDLAKGAVMHKLGWATDEAARYGKYLGVGKVGLGATIGAGSANKDASIEEVLLRAVAGGVATKAVMKYGHPLKRKLANTLDIRTDRYMKAVKGEQFANFSRMKDMAKVAHSKIRNISEWIRQGRYDALHGLDDAQKVKASEFMHIMKNETTRRMNLIMKKDHGATFKEMQELGKTGTKRQRYLNRESNKAMKKIEDYLERNYKPRVLKDTLKGLEKLEKQKIVDSILEWEKHNKAVIGKYNFEKYGITGGPLKSGRGMHGYKWHIDDIFEKKNVKQFKKQKGAFPTKRKMFATSAKNDVPIDSSYGVYADNFAKDFLDDELADAVRFMGDFHDAPFKFKSAELFHKGLEKFDKATSFIKGNMLFFSLSWMRNNYFDNLQKAFIEGHYGALFDSATLGFFRKGVREDLWQLYGGKIDRKYKAEDLQDAFQRGVLDNPLFKAMSDPYTERYLFSDQKLKELKDAKGSFVGKAADWWIDKIGTKGVGRVGSYIEGSARMMTYYHAKEALIKNGVKASRAKNAAAKMVSETFFDYDNLRHAENAILKRAIPFYSYYSKNIDYWAKSFVNPEKVGRIAGIEKVRRNIGHDATDYEKSGLSDYITEGSPRAIGKDQNGNLLFAAIPSNSMHDAIGMLNWERIVPELISKSHPVPKAVVEFISGKDLFTGDNLWATEQENLDPDKKSKKFLFSRGFKYIAIRDGLEALGFDANATIKKFVDVDRKGNPSTTSNYMVAFDKIASTIFPHGMIDQIVGSAYKNVYNKEHWISTVINNLSPMKIISVSPAYHRMVRQRKNKEKQNGR